MSDQGADSNIMSECLLKWVQKEAPNLQIKALKPVQIKKGVTEEPLLTCRWQIRVDIFLRIRQRSRLILRNIVWKVSTENDQIPIIGRRVLESLGYENREMLLAAKDEYGEDIEVEERLS